MSEWPTLEYSSTVAVQHQSTRGHTTHTEYNNQDIHLSTTHTGNVLNHKNEHAIKVITKIRVYYTSPFLKDTTKQYTNVHNTYTGQ